MIKLKINIEGSKINIPLEFKYSLARDGSCPLVVQDGEIQLPLFCAGNKMKIYVWSMEDVMLYVANCDIPDVERTIISDDIDITPMYIFTGPWPEDKRFMWLAVNKNRTSNFYVDRPMFDKECWIEVSKAGKTPGPKDLIPLSIAFSWKDTLLRRPLDV